MKPLATLSEDDIANLARRARGELLSAPAALVERAAGIWRARALPAAPASPGAPALLKRLLAGLRFDSWTADPALAVRSEPSATRQLLFSVEGVDIDVRLQATTDAASGLLRFAINGQVLGPAGPCALVLMGDGVEVRCELDEFGEFAFEPVAAGPVRLIVFVGGLAVELPVIDVGDGGGR